MRRFFEEFSSEILKNPPVASKVSPTSRNMIITFLLQFAFLSESNALEKFYLLSFVFNLFEMKCQNSRLTSSICRKIVFLGLKSIDVRLLFQCKTASMQLIFLIKQKNMCWDSITLCVRSMQITAFIDAKNKSP